VKRFDSNGKPNKETRIKMRKAQLGKKHTEESKLKMSKRMSGKNHPMYGKKGY
jgi:hypothetical protein